jgi:hypothetical protein
MAFHHSCCFWASTNDSKCAASSLDFINIKPTFAPENQNPRNSHLVTRRKGKTRKRKTKLARQQPQQKAKKISWVRILGAGIH